MTPDQRVVLVSHAGLEWGFPGGRRVGSESWEETLMREIREEACATVRAARLLGFYRGTDLDGLAACAPLVRSVWRAEVGLPPWLPAFEITARKLVRPADLLTHLTVHQGELPLINRIRREARLE